MQIGGHHAQGNFHVLDFFDAELLIDVLGQGIASHDATRDQRHSPIGEHGLVHDLGDALQLCRCLTAGVKSRHDTPGRCAHNQLWLDTGFFEHFNHADMGKSSGGSTPQGQPQANGLFQDRWRGFAR